MGAISLDYFEGSWGVERTIDDARSRESGSFLGIATFSREGEQLRFDEDGTVRFAAYRGRATRRLFYACADGRLDVSFADGHHFVTLSLDESESCDVHLCGDDHYTITTIVRSANEFEELWRVLGPSKDYRAATTYRRLGD